MPRPARPSVPSPKRKRRVGPEEEPRSPHRTTATRRLRSGLGYVAADSVTHPRRPTAEIRPGRNTSRPAASARDADSRLLTLVRRAVQCADRLRIQIGDFIPHGGWTIGRRGRRTFPSAVHDRPGKESSGSSRVSSGLPQSATAHARRQTASWIRCYWDSCRRSDARRHVLNRGEKSDPLIPDSTTGTDDGARG